MRLATFAALAGMIALPGPALALDKVTFGTNWVADTARLPMKPIKDIVADTVEKTRTVWRELPQKDLLPNDVLKIIDGQIAKAIAGTDLD